MIRYEIAVANQKGERIVDGGGSTTQHVKIPLFVWTEFFLFEINF